MNTKLTIGVLIGIIAVLVIILTLTLTQNNSSTTNDTQNIILTRFDKKDVKRLNELVQRHNNGDGDYLMLIPPVIDGGYWIYDVRSNGKEITWTIDNTRDGMSAENDRGKKVYQCKSISLNEKPDSYEYMLDKCENLGDKSIPIFRISK
ncbi:DUF4362 domain-containing protein [Paenibacillus glycanilyticus]|uniref:DUF4362 domain-containing protein n=1 Tax=Paenibacillus glycanilyticus TaxID=126569 RepID=UPI00190FECC7|nr:DUF4362 domain-containing protein [Paenibacillus glycanilyticus]